jgi:hypothetical protein
VEPWTLTFTTEIDTVAPRYVAGWPAGRTGVSPQAVPWLRFDESVDPSSFGTDDLALSDLLGNRPRFRIEASPDRRTIYLVPEQALTPGRLYLLSLNGGTDGPTDSNGNRIQSTTTFSFSVGTDAAPPTISDSFPADGAAGIGTELTAQVRFSEAIDADTVDVERVRLVRVSDGAGVPATVTTTGGTTIELVPDDELERDAEYRVEILGGRDGVCDMAGNPLPTTANATFRTSSTGVGMTVLVQPFNGAVGVPRGARVSATFSEPVDPATVRPTTFRVYRTNDLAPVAGTLQVLRGGRVVRFLPTFAWGATTSYTVEVLGGVDGVRSADGERPLQRTSLFRFTTGTGVDSRAPDVAVTLNGIGDLRKSNLTVPSLRLHDRRQRHGLHRLLARLQLVPDPADRPVRRHDRSRGPVRRRDRRRALDLGARPARGRVRVRQLDRGRHRRGPDGERRVVRTVLVPRRLADGRCGAVRPNADGVGPLRPRPQRQRHR